jgi:hypothetical protein
MGYFWAISIGLLEFLLFGTYYKIRGKFGNNESPIVHILKVITVLLELGGILAAMKLAWHYPGTDPGMAGFIAIIPGCIGAWFFKKQYKAKRPDDDA